MNPPRTLVVEELPPANLDFVQAHSIRLVQIAVEGNKVGPPRSGNFHGKLSRGATGPVPVLGRKAESTRLFARGPWRLVATKVLRSC